MSVSKRSNKSAARGPLAIQQSPLAGMDNQEPGGTDVPPGEVLKGRFQRISEDTQPLVYLL